MSQKFTLEDRIRQDILLFTVNGEFMADIEKIRNIYDLPYFGDDEDFFLEAYMTGLNKDIDNLRKKYNIPESHDLDLGRFICTGDFRLREGGFRADFWHLNPCPITSESQNYIEIKIYPDTTLEDIQESWPQIKKARDKLLDLKIRRKTKIENLDRDLEIFRLRKEGYKDKEIARAINSNEKYKGVILGYEQIPKIIGRLKNMAEKNLPPKKT